MRQSDILIDEKGGAEEMEEQIVVKKCTCNKCGHSWIPRTQDIPTTCANAECRSPNWNRPRTSETTNAKQ